MEHQVLPYVVAWFICHFITIKTNDKMTTTIDQFF
jgi:hypothetical protein